MTPFLIMPLKLLLKTGAGQHGGEQGSNGYAMDLSSRPSKQHTQICQPGNCNSALMHPFHCLVSLHPLEHVIIDNARVGAMAMELCNETYFSWLADCY